MFVSLLTAEPEGFNCLCVCFAPLKHEDKKSAEKHAARIELMMELYCKKKEKVVTAIVDNCYINQCVANLTECQFTGNASYDFILATKDVVQVH